MAVTPDSIVPQQENQVTFKVTHHDVAGPGPKVKIYLDTPGRYKWDANGSRCGSAAFAPNMPVVWMCQLHVPRGQSKEVGLTVPSRPRTPVKYRLAWYADGREKSISGTLPCA